MQTLTDDLLDILAAQFQGAARGYRCRMEIDFVIPGATEIGAETNLVPLYGTASEDPENTQAWSPSVALIADGNESSSATTGLVFPPHHNGVIVDLGAIFDATFLRFNMTDGGSDHPEIVQYGDDGVSWTSLMSNGVGPSAWSTDAPHGVRLTPDSPPISARYWRAFYSGPFANNYTWNEFEIFGQAVEVIDDELGTVSFTPRRVGRDVSRRMAASQLEVEIPRQLLGASLLSAVQTHAPIRVWQWYGDGANEVRTFTGLIDSLHEGRDPRDVAIVARDRAKVLIVQTFSATAPQNAGETGAVRTEANGVFLEQDAAYIVGAILDMAGWPSADRDIAPTSFALDEYIISDGSSWAEAIIGENALTGLTGYDAWVDELGVFHFRPMLASAAPDADTDPTPDYSYVVADAGSDNLVSRNVLRLDHEIDDYDLKTRVKVRGNLAIAVPAWTELWHTNTFNKPVGIWFDSAEPNHIRVLDRGTKKIYRYKTSKPRDRDPAGIWPLYVGGHVDFPLGLSGDPSNTNFWVLDAAWRATGSANLNASVHKYSAAGTHLAEYSLPDGEWSDLKVSGSWLVLTNKTTDKISQRSKADGTAHANTTVTYNGNDQLNPTGVFVDGTTYGLFFLGHARFLLVDESDPSTIDPTNALGIASGKISTAGSAIYGGEINPDHAHLWSCNDDLGLVTYYALTEPDTDEVFSEVVDTDLEDSLGFLAGLEPREHDTHPGDPDHPFEVRRATVTLEKTITNLAQATETALRVLDELAHRRETIDFGVVGHPGHQRGDLHQLTDPVTGIDALYVLDTYRDNMDERGFLGTIAYVPYEPSY